MTYETYNKRKKIMGEGIRQTLKENNVDVSRLCKDLNMSQVMLSCIMRGDLACSALFVAELEIWLHENVDQHTELKRQEPNLDWVLAIARGEYDED